MLLANHLAKPRATKVDRQRIAKTGTLVIKHKKTDESPLTNLFGSEELKIREEKRHKHRLFGPNFFQGQLSRGGFKRGGLPDLDLSFLFCPFLSFLGLSADFSKFFPICSGMVRGFSRFVPFLRNSPKSVRDTIWTFPQKSGKPSALETLGLASWFSFSQFLRTDIPDPCAWMPGVNNSFHITRPQENAPLVQISTIVGADVHDRRPGWGGSKRVRR